MKVQRSIGTLVLVAILSLALVPAAPASSASGPPSRCPTVTFVPSVGPACLTDAGLLAVYGEAGAYLGTTHGVDPAPATNGSATPASSSLVPSCVRNPTSADFYAQVIYARPSDVPDAYAAKQGTILTTLSNANGFLHDAAVATGGTADLKVQCDGTGAIVVFNAVLSHTRATSNSFSNVVSDLQALGYTATNVKHWVFVDGGATDICSCGVGHIMADDTLALGNLNNGNQGFSEFAVDWSMTSAHIALHELSHNMGAVQRTAPHTTSTGPGDPNGNAWHCNDGLDTMCYQDGGANQCTSGFSCPGTCAVEVYDCGNNDYFSRNPAAANYLATHWNIGNALNRFVNFGIPSMTTFACTSPIGVTQATTCTLRAIDDSTGVFYTVVWGDGSTTLVPATGTVAPGTTQTATHTYATGGVKSATATATDNGSPAQTSASVASSITVDATAPTTTLNALTSLAATADASASPAWYASNYQYTLAATDTGGTGVDKSFDNLDGGAYTTYAGTVTVTGEGAHTIRYNSIDKGANNETPKTKSIGIDITPPTTNVPTLSCNPCLGGVSVSFSAGDPTSKLYSAVLEWNLAASTTQALAGQVCSAGGAQGAATITASCNFAGAQGILPGQYCFDTKATDRAGNVARSAATCTLIL